MASKNAADYPYMDTVLFFDEANTTEAIGVIKEIMCDKSLGGKPIKILKLFLYIKKEILLCFLECKPIFRYLYFFEIIHPIFN
jgi:hypothetical protein